MHLSRPTLSFIAAFVGYGLLLALPEVKAEDKKPAASETASAVVETRTAFKSTLETEILTLSRTQSTAWTNCIASRADYESATQELAPVQTELAQPEKTSLGKLQADYRNKLEALKASLEKKIASAKTKASDAGHLITSVLPKIREYRAEIARIEAIERQEALAKKATNSSATGGLIGAVGTQYGSGGLGARDEGWGEDPNSKAEPKKLLPSEFALCFPGEAETTTK